MPARDPFVRYLSLLAVCTLAFVLCVLAFNLLVDPYGLVGTPPIDGISARKVRATQEPLAFRAAAVTRNPARTVVLGNSRAEIGLDPDSAGWPAASRPVFNLAIPGAGLATAAELLAVAARARLPATVIVGADFPDFLHAENRAPVAAVPVRLDSVRAIDAATLARTELSIDSLWNSILTVAQQRNPDATELTLRGFNPLREYRQLVRTEGEHAIFEQKDAEYAQRFARGPRSVTEPGRAWSSEFRQLLEILSFCREHHLKVRVVIYPYHADLMEILAAAKLWPVYEEWKRLLVRAVADQGAGADIEVWDFSGYSAYATERIPPPGDRSTMTAWFWESGHFKSQLGDLMIADLAAGDARLGVRLTPSNVEDHLQQLRASQLAYRAAHPAEVEHLRALVSASRPN